MKKIAIALAMMVVLLFPTQAVAYGDQGVPPNDKPQGVERVLPDTGGASKGILVGGIVLIVVGGVAIALIRRRR